MPTKFENMIMDQYVQTAYGPADDFTQMGTEMAGGAEPPGATPMTLKEFATSAADVPAGLLKGAVQGTLGIAGDIESIVYGVRELFKRGADESRLDAFLRGIGEGTVLPTTDDVKKWMDTNVGPLVPAGASERRREAAKIPEFVGELGGAGQTVIEGSRAAARGARQIGREIATTPPTGSIGGADTSYRGFHSAPTRDFGAQLHQLDQIFPDDIYSSQAARLYGHYGSNDPMDRQTIKLAQSLRNKPDADVTIYRAVPKNLNVQEINPGDWVTINQNYAKEHGESVLRGNYKILQKRVKAKDIWTNADSIHEYGYDPS